MGKLKLTVNEKTRICRVPEGEFDFLGYTFNLLHRNLPSDEPFTSRSASQPPHWFG